MSCINNRCCHINWPCQEPKKATLGTTLVVAAVGFSLLVTLVATGAIGKARISAAGAVTLNLLMIVVATAGGILIHKGGPKKVLIDGQK